MLITSAWAGHATFSRCATHPTLDVVKQQDGHHQCSLLWEGQRISPSYSVHPLQRLGHLGSQRLGSSRQTGHSDRAEEQITMQGVNLLLRG